MTPRPMREIRNVEITSLCNLACAYCLHPTMPRPKLHMTEETWQRVLVWVEHFKRKGTQREINLNGTGEPTMHPKLVDWCADVRQLLGPEAVIQFTTNGKGVTRGLVEALKPLRPQVCVTAHFAHVAGPAAALFREAGLLRHVSNDPVTSPQNWAGQVNWPQAINFHDKRPTCMLLVLGLGTINADGTFPICCMDGTGESTRGTVYDDPATTTITLEDWRLCASCWQQPPKG